MENPEPHTRFESAIILLVSILVQNVTQIRLILS